LPEASRGVLITRPEPGASETAARVTELGWRPLLAPVLEIRALPSRLPQAADVQAIVIASGNAIPNLPRSHHHVPVYAVGAATAERARAAGFTLVSSADGDAGALATLVDRCLSPKTGALLLATGRGQGGALAAGLRASGFRVIRRAVYAAAPVAPLPETACRALSEGAITAAMFFSTETARHAVGLLRRARLHEAVRTIDALAIGRPAAVALQALPWRRIRVASRPTQEAMLALLR
jgi:uroporphyrinogen-III synthase